MLCAPVPKNRSWVETIVIFFTFFFLSFPSKWVLVREYFVGRVIGSRSMISLINKIMKILLRLYSQKRERSESSKERKGDSSKKNYEFWHDKFFFSLHICTNTIHCINICCLTCTRENIHLCLNFLIHFGASHTHTHAHALEHEFSVRNASEKAAIIDYILAYDAWEHRCQKHWPFGTYKMNCMHHTKNRKDTPRIYGRNARNAEMREACSERARLQNEKKN